LLLVAIGLKGGVSFPFNVLVGIPVCIAIITFPKTAA
jgi:hypothetical protein